MQFEPSTEPSKVFVLGWKDWKKIAPMLKDREVKSGERNVYIVTVQRMRVRDR